MQLTKLPAARMNIGMRDGKQVRHSDPVHVFLLTSGKYAVAYHQVWKGTGSRESEVMSFVSLVPNVMIIQENLGEYRSQEGERRIHRIKAEGQVRCG